MSQIKPIERGHKPWLKAVVLVFVALFLSLSLAGPASAQDAGSAESNDPGFIGGLVNDALGALATMVGEAVTTALSNTLGAVVNNTNAQVWTDCSVGSVGCWFQSQYALMKTIGVAILAPMILLSIIQAVTKGSLFQIIKTMLIFLPIAFLGTAVAAQMVQLLLQVTDDFSAVFLTSSQTSLATVQENISSFYSNQEAPSAANSFVLILLAIPLLLACVFVWLILVLRSASIYLATLFLPIGFAMLVWPAAARQFRRLAQFLIAMILSKLVMVAGISLAMASFAAIGSDTSVPNIGLNGTVVDTAASGASSGDLNSIALNQIILFTAMLIVICFAPNTLMKFLDNFSVSDAAGALNSHTSRLSTVSQIIFLSRLTGMKANVRKIRQEKEKLRQETIKAQNQSPLDASMEQVGVAKKPPGNGIENGYEKTVAELKNSRIQNQILQQQIINLTNSNNPSSIVLGNIAFALGDDTNSELLKINRKGPNDEYSSVTRRVTDPVTGQSWVETALLSDLGVKSGGPMVKDDPVMAKRAAVKAIQSGSDKVVFISANPQRTKSQQQSAQVFAASGGNTYKVIAGATGPGNLNDQMRVASTS